MHHSWKMISLRSLDLHAVFAGTLDLVTGVEISPTTVSGLKHLALFYDHIVFPDGLAFAYGSLTSHVHRLLRESPHTANCNEIIALGRAGILVPAIRTQTSLHETWDKGIHGVAPGNYLCLGKDDDSHRVLEFLDETFTVRADAGEEIAELRSAQAMGWNGLIEKHLLNDESPTSLKSYLASQPPNVYPAHVWLRVRSQAETFIGELQNRLGQSDFRRGHVEDDVVSVFYEDAFRPSFDKTIYSKVLHDNSSSDAETQLRARVASHFLNALATTYQASHAASMAVYGGLFSDHHRDLVAMGLYDDIGTEGGAISLGSKSAADPLFSDVVDLSDLSIDSIIKIRGEELFRTDLHAHFHDWLVAATRETHRIEDSTAKFCTSLNAKYFPRILKESPKMQARARRLEAYSGVMHAGLGAAAGAGAAAGYFIGGFGGIITTALSVTAPLIPRAHGMASRYLQNRSRTQGSLNDLGQYARRLNPSLERD